MNVTGKLLLAVPALSDPNFHQSVLFIIDHAPAGAFGVILNRPTTLDVVDPLPGAAASEPAVVFEGGPVQREGALAIATVGGEVEGWSPLPEAPGSDLGLVDVERAMSEGWPATRQLRIFSGHAGWSAGQLDSELADDGWVAVSARGEDLFTSTPSTLYQDVLLRAGTSPLLAEFLPDDPRLN
ncbi:MAG: YqgE/AlgH family protein [Acidimicrobiia bacterium]|nr:YqgE/AlgH family protein [Acidimicrobiia bacterium]